MSMPSAGEVELTILIVNYNTAHLLAEMFAAVETAAAGLSLQIIVVDNASRDGSAELLRQRYPGAELIENQANVGFARANNQAVPLVRGKHVLLLNTDAFIAADTLTKTLSYLKAHPECGVLGVRLCGRDGGPQPSCRFFPTPLNVFLMRTGFTGAMNGVRLIDAAGWTPKASQDCDWVPGCYYMMPRAALDQVGLFDPRFFLYYEEVDHCRAVRRAGWSVHYFADTTVVHIGGESARSVGELTAAGRQVSALQIESELLYFRKHYGIPGLWASLLLTALADAWLGLKSMLQRPLAASPALHSNHTATVFSLIRRTAWATRPTR